MSLNTLLTAATLVANFPRFIHGLTDVPRQHLHLRMDTAHRHHASVEVDFDGAALLQTSFGTQSQTGNVVSAKEEHALAPKGPSFTAYCEDFLAAFNVPGEQSRGPHEESLSGMCASLAPPSACRAAAEGPLLQRPWSREAMSQACLILFDAVGSSSSAAVSGPALSQLGADVEQPQPGDPVPGSPFETGAMFPVDVLSPDLPPEHHIYNETLANSSNATNATDASNASSASAAALTTTVTVSPIAGNGTNASNATFTATVTVDPYAHWGNATRVVNASDIIVEDSLGACEDAINGSNASIMCTTTPAPNATTTAAPVSTNTTTPATNATTAPATNATATAEPNTTTAL